MENPELGRAIEIYNMHLKGHVQARDRVSIAIFLFIYSLLYVLCTVLL